MNGGIAEESEMGAWRWLVPIALTAAIACGCGAAPVASGGGAETPAGGGESSGGSSEVSDFVLKGWSLA